MNFRKWELFSGPSDTVIHRLTYITSISSLKCITTIDVTVKAYSILRVAVIDVILMVYYCSVMVVFLVDILGKLLDFRDNG